jgi:pimeloyl-ACP methyl ester carboxylesterase
VISADLRNANGGDSSSLLNVDRPWDAYTDDHIGLMDHLGIRQFMVLGFCIGGPFIWNLVKRVPDRLVAAVPTQPSGYRPEMPSMSYNNNMKGWGPELCGRRPNITTAMVGAFLTNMYTGARADFIYSVTRDVVRTARRRSWCCRTTFQYIRTASRWENRASCAQRAGQPLSVEGHTGRDSAGGAPH